MGYSDVIHHSNCFFELGLNMLVVQSCDLSCMEYSDVIHCSDRVFELSLNMLVA